eukprot:594775_1
MRSRSANSACLCHFIRWNTSINVRYISVRRYLSQLESPTINTQSIDDIFNDRRVNGPSLSTAAVANTKELIPGLNKTNTINDALLDRISKYFKHNPNAMCDSQETELLLTSFATKLSSLHTLNRRQSAKIYAFITNTLQTFAHHHKIPNKKCIESMIHILLSLDCTTTEHHIAPCLYSLLDLASMYNPVSFETYTSVMEYVSTQNVTSSWTVQNKQDCIKYILHLLIKAKHKDESDIERLASMYLTDYKPHTIAHTAQSKPSSVHATQQQHKLIKLVKKTQGNLLSFEQLSQVYENEYKEILPFQTVVQYALQQMTNIKTQDITVTSYDDQWHNVNAPRTVSTWLSQLRQMLRHKQILNDAQIATLWKTKYDTDVHEMYCMQNCMFDEWHSDANGNAMSEEYQLLLQLPKSDATGFRIMSVLCYAWDSITVRFDTQCQDWQYMLRDETPSTHNDAWMQAIHQKNITRILCNETPSAQWRLNDIIGTIERYLHNESRVKFPEISHIKYGNNLFKNVLQLFKGSQFTWTFEMEKTAKWKRYWYWHCSVQCSTNISKIQNIVAQRGGKGIQYDEICKMYTKQYGHQTRDEIPSKDDLVRGYCHILGVKHKVNGDVVFYAKDALPIDDISRFESQSFMDDMEYNPTQRICKLLSIKPRTTQHKEQGSSSYSKFIQQLECDVPKTSRFCVDYNENITCPQLAEMYEKTYGILPIPRFDVLLKHIGFDIDTTYPHSLKFVPKDCVPSLTMNHSDNCDLLISIFKPFSIGNQVLNLLFGGANQIISNQFLQSFEEIYGYPLSLTPKQFYFYLYHQFYPFITLMPFDSESDSFVIHKDDACSRACYPQILISNVQQFKHSFVGDIDAILDAHVDGIEFHAFWKELQGKTNQIIYIRFDDEQSLEDGDSPQSMFNEMQQFTHYSKQWMEIWKDSSANAMWEAFVTQNNEDIQVFLKKRQKPQPKPQLQAMNENVGIAPGIAPVKNLNEDYAVKVFGMTERIKDSVLKSHLNYYLNQEHMKKKKRKWKKHESIGIEHIDRSKGFVYFANQLSFQLALDVSQFCIGNERLRLKKMMKKKRKYALDGRWNDVSKESQRLVREYLDDDDAERSVAHIHSDIGYIKQHMSLKRFRVFLIDECHSFVRLCAPSIKRGTREWSVTTDISIPSHSPHLTDNEQRILGAYDKLVHTIALYPQYGLKMDEIVTCFERETGRAYPSGARLTDDLRDLMSLQLIRRNDRHSFGVPSRVRNGLFLKRLLSFYPEGLPYVQLERKWKEFEYEERRKRAKKHIPLEHLKVSPFVDNLDGLVDLYSNYARIRYINDDAADAPYDVNKVMLFPKLDPDKMNGIKELNRKGKIYGFNVMQSEDKLDLVLNQYEGGGVNICEFVDEYELMIGTQPATNAPIFKMLSQYKIHFDVQSPAIFTTVCPNMVKKKLADILQQQKDGIFDDELDALWQTVYDEELYIQHQRPIVLYDKYYSLIKVMHCQEGRIKYTLRSKLMQDNQTEMDPKHLNFVRIIRDTFYEYSQTHNSAMPFIQFIDYFEATHRRSFPSTRSLRRVLSKCNVKLIHNDCSIHNIICILNPL